MSDQPENFNDDAYDEQDAERVDSARSRLAGEESAQSAGRNLEDQIRGAIANWVGASPDDDWETVGRMWEANTRGRIAGIFDAKPAEDRDDVTWDDIGQTVDHQLRKTVGGWAGAEEGDDWGTVGKKIDTQIRSSLDKTVGAKAAAEDDAAAPAAEAEPAAPEADAEPAAAEPAAEPASWDEIGSNLEKSIRGGIGSWVQAGPEASWDEIGDKFGDRVRNLFGIVKEAETSDDPFGAPPTAESSTGARKVRVEIDTDDDAPAGGPRMAGGEEEEEVQA